MTARVWIRLAAVILGLAISTIYGFTWAAIGPPPLAVTPILVFSYIPPIAMWVAAGTLR